MLCDEKMCDNHNTHFFYKQLFYKPPQAEASKKSEDEVEKRAKEEVCFVKIKMRMKNRSHRLDINRPTS